MQLAKVHTIVAPYHKTLYIIARPKFLRKAVENLGEPARGVGSVAATTPVAV